MAEQPMVERIKDATEQIRIVLSAIGEWSWERERELLRPNRDRAAEAAIKVRSILYDIERDLETDKLIDPLTTEIRRVITEMIRNHVEEHREEYHGYTE